MAKDVRSLKKAFINRDRVVRGITEDGLFRIAVINASKAAGVAAERHALSPVAGAFLARALSGAALLSSFLKGEERIILEAMGKGPLGKVYAEALQVGELRGYVENPTAHLEPATGETARIEDALGVGVLRVSKYLYNKFEPVTGIVDLQTGDVSTDLARYLLQSEQIPSAVILDVSLDTGGGLKKVGGLMVQAMPGASEEAITHIQENIREILKVTDLLEAGYQPEEILKMLSRQPVKLLATTPLDFYCRCSLERFKQQLHAFEASDIRDMQRNDQRELVCRYCNEKYYLSDTDFSELLGPEREGGLN